MSADGTVEINGKVIGRWHAVRSGASVEVGPDSVHAYRWSWYEGGPPYRTRPRSGLIHHRYGDGAVALAAAVLREVTPSGGEPT